MHGYGEYILNDGKKYMGFFKKDKKDGFGIYYCKNDRFFLGFWKEGKQNGLGKYYKENGIKYGIWKEGKREKWLKNEDEFINYIDPKEEIYEPIFRWNKEQIKNFMEINEHDDYHKIQKTNILKINKENDEKNKSNENKFSSEEENEY